MEWVRLLPADPIGWTKDPHIERPVSPTSRGVGKRDKPGPGAVGHVPRQPEGIPLCPPKDAALAEGRGNKVQDTGLAGHGMVQGLDRRNRASRAACMSAARKQAFFDARRHGHRDRPT
jgi:hypothetical protein